MTIRRLFGRVLVPGIHQRQWTPTRFPCWRCRTADAGPVDEAAVREALAAYMFAEPEFRPPWLGPAQRPLGADRRLDRGAAWPGLDPGNRRYTLPPAVSYLGNSIPEACKV